MQTKTSLKFLPQPDVHTVMCKELLYQCINEIVPVDRYTFQTADSTMRVLPHNVEPQAKVIGFLSLLFSPLFYFPREGRPRKKGQMKKKKKIY